jgi:RimJ/RimL family protein N-acetyltransferase
MDIGLIDDMEAVKSFVSQDELWECEDDLVQKDDFYPSNDSLSQWLYCYDDGKIVGMILVHNETSVSIKMHPYLLKAHREKGREMMKVFYNHFMNLPNHINKLNVSIPVIHKKVINFAKKVGFRDEGINRGSYFKNGKYHDQVNMGLLRSEIARLSHE